MSPDGFGTEQGPVLLSDLHGCRCAPLCRRQPLAGPVFRVLVNLPACQSAELREEKQRRPVSLAAAHGNTAHVFAITGNKNEWKESEKEEREKKRRAWGCG